jgi:prolyl-tRNA editing enzyme YbaK/EbsC (Cys-tRNA(Pro) deacylase)
MTHHQKAVTAIHKATKTERRFTVYLKAGNRERKVEMSEADLIAMLQKNFGQYVIELRIEEIEVGKTHIGPVDNSDFRG